jgi:carboxypeptidase C (cathepsin A)/subtilisin family serine protease
MGPDLWEMFEDGKEDDEVAAIVRLGRSGVLPKDVRIVTQFSEIVTVRMRRGDIPKVSGAPEVADITAGDAYLGPDVELESASPSELSSDTVLPTDERRPAGEAATGRGVVVGVIDWGFDFAHPDFRNKDGSTRILALWDQRGSKRPGSPQPFGYGIVHDREAINRALKTRDPYAALGYHPADADTGVGCHGTHVLSIATGSGGEDRPTGIAPEADIIVVHNSPWDEAEPSKLGDSVTVLEGIDFIARNAGERPWVINLSMGRHGEQHDGSTLVEQGFDAAIRSTPGRAICLSTGNYFDKRIHASGQLRPTQERTLVWEILEGKPTYNQLEFWYSGQDKFELAINSPESAITARVKIGERAKLMVGGTEVGNVYHRSQEANNLANHITIFLYKEAPAGAWEVTLVGTDVIDGRYHAWIERDVSCPKCQSRFRPEDASPRSTTGTICNGRRTFGVGAFDKHDTEPHLGHFSSSGPTLDGRLKPDLCAPGVSVLAARSATRDTKNPAPLLTRMSGTSMAAPHVTGTIALMFQAAPRRLRIEETHNLLLQSSQRVSIPDEIPDRIGIGFLNTSEAVDAARKLRSASSAYKQFTAKAHTAGKAASGGRDSETAGQQFVEGEFGREAWFESKAADEYDISEADGYRNTFHRIANDITGAFEGGKTDTLNLYDLGIISYGKHQATLASGTLYGILRRYTELSKSQSAVKMSSYLERVNRGDESLREDAEFVRLLKDAAKDPEMERAQDEEFSRQYWEPAKARAAKGNVKSALGHVIFYDTRVQGGLEQVHSKTEALLGGKVGDAVKAKAITEGECLRTFMQERIKRLLRISAIQKKKGEDLEKEAEGLEDGAASDPQQADDLKRQAAQKRKKAKQFAANAAALEASANKTRGPSLMALVESGDLNLYDGEAEKIHLKGSRGVAIDSLQPGATIDATTAREAELGSLDAAQAEGFVGHQRTSNGARGLVEIADEVVNRGGSRLAAVAVLDEMLSRTGAANRLAEGNSGLLPSPAEIFDSFAYPRAHSNLRKQLDMHFEVVGLPGGRLESEVREGDVMVRRSDAEAAHVAVIARPELKSLRETQAEGLKPESLNAGNYAEVVEAGYRPHTSSDHFARQLTDSFGRVLNDIVLLRLASPAPTVVTVNQSLPSKDDPFSSSEMKRQAQIDQEAIRDGEGYYDMTEEPPVVTRHQITIYGTSLKYTATTGRLPIKRGDGQIEAEMFFVAYTLDGQEVSKRPLTFAFNGGPGSASLWLHIGALGPRKVAMQSEGFLPPAPYRITDNEHTLLDKSDLVLIDAIGTGFSRAADPNTFKKFWGVQGDIEAFSEFIRLYITRNERWGSPLYIIGESYGTMRAAGIAGYLAEKGISFNGITLLSTVLNYETLEDTASNDQPYIFLIPSFTMIAGYHNKLPADLARDMAHAREESEKWASGEYAQALAKGDALTFEERRTVIDQLSRFTGLSKEVIDEANLRINVGAFTRYLLIDQKVRVGRFDGRFTGPDPYGLLDTRSYDPTESSTHPPFTSVFNNYLRTELEYKTDMPYYVRAEGADFGEWDWGSAIGGFPDTASAIRQAILKNPYLKILVMEGYYDLATPYSAANYTIDHLALPQKYRSNISFAAYESGHMVYLPEESLKKMKRDQTRFMERSGPAGLESSDQGEVEALCATRMAARSRAQRA